MHLELEDTEIFERYLFWRTLTICVVFIPDRNDDGADGEGLAESWREWRPDPTGNSKYSVWKACTEDFQVPCSISGCVYMHNIKVIIIRFLELPDYTNCHGSNIVQYPLGIWYWWIQLIFCSIKHMLMVLISFGIYNLHMCRCASRNPEEEEEESRW